MLFADGNCLGYVTMQTYVNNNIINIFDLPSYKIRYNNHPAVVTAWYGFCECQQFLRDLSLRNNLISDFTCLYIVGYLNHCSMSKTNKGDNAYYCVALVITWKFVA